MPVKLIGSLWKSDSGLAGVSVGINCLFTLPLVPTVYGGKVNVCCWSCGIGGLSVTWTMTWAAGTGVSLVILGSVIVMFLSSISLP